MQGALWLVGLGALGLAWAYPDAISRLRRHTAPYAAADAACAGRCSAHFPDGTVVTMTADPQPVANGQPVRLRVEVDGPSRPVAVELQGADMAMGFLHLPLVDEGGAWSVTVDLPACTTARMRWRADVILSDRVAGFTLWSTR